MKRQTSKALVFMVFLFPIIIWYIFLIITCNVLGFIWVIEELRLDKIAAKILIEVSAIWRFLSSLRSVVTKYRRFYFLLYCNSNTCPLLLSILADIVLLFYCMCLSLPFLSIMVEMLERSLVGLHQLHYWRLPLIALEHF